MSGPSSMSCERCSELITELVCGELDAAQAAEVRAHAEGCARCAAELASFTEVLSVAQSLPLETPSPAFEQRIMQAAREANARRAAGAQAIDSGSPATGLRAWLERLSSWAMSPQVAMASVLLLVVGIGLYALPFGHEGSGSLQISQEPKAASAPAATAAGTPVPAEEMSDDEALAAEAPAEPARPEAPQAFPEKKLAEERAEAASNRYQDLEPVAAGEGAEREKASSSVPRARSAAKPSKSAAASGGDAYLEGLADDRAYAPPPPAPEPQAAKGKKDESSAEQSRKDAPATIGGAGAGFGAPVPAAAAPADSSPAMDSRGPDFTTMYADGMRAAQAGAHARAVELLMPVVEKGPTALRNDARIQVARSLRALDQCARALVYYRVIVASDKTRPELLNEAADCYERAGQADQAEKLRLRTKGGRN